MEASEKISAERSFEHVACRCVCGYFFSGLLISEFG